MNGAEEMGMPYKVNVAGQATPGERRSGRIYMPAGDGTGPDRRAAPVTDEGERRERKEPENGKEGKNRERAGTARGHRNSTAKQG